MAKWYTKCPQKYPHSVMVFSHVETLKSQLTSSLIINISRVSDAAISHGRSTRWLGSPYNGISGSCTSIQLMVLLILSVPVEGGDLPQKWVGTQESLLIEIF